MERTSSAFLCALAFSSVRHMVLQRSEKEIPKSTPGRFGNADDRVLDEVQVKIMQFVSRLVREKAPPSEVGVKDVFIDV